MTVAAVILAESSTSALADADGTPAVRRLVSVAWAGGAIPIVVCSFDLDGTVGTALATAEVTLVAPVAPELGPVGQIANGIDAAMRLMAGTDAVLVLPARLAWVDAETVTTLVAAHGADRHTVLRPAFGGEPGFPALLPVAHLETFRTLAPDRMPGELMEDLATAGVPIRVIDTGDPGVVHDIATRRAELPPYDGPPEPADPHAHEWGAAAADDADDAPVLGAAGMRAHDPAS